MVNNIKKLGLELDSDGKILSHQLPSISINDVFVTNVQDGRLTIEGDLNINVEPGDMVVESYPTPSRTYIKDKEPSDSVDSWVQISQQEAPVQTIFGKTGDIIESDADHNKLTNRTHSGDNLSPNTITTNSLNSGGPISDGDGIERQFWFINNGDPIPSAAKTTDIIFEKEI